MLEQVRADGLLAEGRPVVVLLSGGRDSTCLLDLAARISGPAAVVALHVNYGLRDAADADEAHCRALCGRMRVGLEVRHPRRPETGNLQAWARDQRYGAAAELAAAQHSATAHSVDVAAGHTATEQVETILYRLASSPSRRALLGMKSREGLLIRPLLAFAREDTAAYCTARGLTWREDESNMSDQYARGRVRAGLVPALEAIHPAAVENVLALADTLRDEAEVLDQLVDETLGGRREIELKRLRALPLPIARLTLQRLADDAAGRPAPGTARRADDILALNDDAALDLPHGVRVLTKGGVLRVVRQPADARAARSSETGCRAGG